jgi:hypothetical protein
MLTVACEKCDSEDCAALIEQLARDGRADNPLVPGRLRWRPAAHFASVSHVLTLHPSLHFGARLDAV